jgi:hypothetical protein
VPEVRFPGEPFGGRDFRAPGRPDRPDRPRRRDSYGYGIGIGYGGYIDPDRGYFATGGEALPRGSSGVHYDYDRGYPYAYYRPRREESAAYEAAPRAAYCETKWTRGLGSERVPVRICRN